MKKLFFFAAAAIAMLASCQKNELGNTQTSGIDDSKPAAIQFNVNAPSFDVKTRAAVDAWDETEVYLYGIKQQRDDNNAVIPFGEGMYDFEEILINNQLAKVLDADTPLEVYQTPAQGSNETNVPYFYGEGQTYDFFGYHLGGANAVINNPANDVISYQVTIDGSQDLMVAAADKENDIMDDTSTDGVTVADIYSAWAARRGVHPTLVFNHALTRFNFIVRGMTQPSDPQPGDETVTVTGISLVDVATTGTLTVVGQELGFTQGDLSETATENVLKLKTIEDDGTEVDFEAETVVFGNTNVAGNGSCIMFAPNLENVKVKVDLKHGKYPNTVELDPYEFTINASQVLKDGAAAGLTKFLAGDAYNIYINVYGPEKIVIKAELTEWKPAGDYTYDPDTERPGGNVTNVTATRDYDDDTKTVSYSIEYTASIKAIQAAIAKEQPAADSDAWQNLVDTRATTGISFKVPSGENAANYKLYVRYTTATEKPGEGESEAWTTTQVAASVAEKSIVDSFFYVTNTEESWNQLPEAYLENHPWDDAFTTYPENAELPWLVVLLDEAYRGKKVSMTMTYNGAAVPFTGSTGEGWGDAVVADNVFTITAGQIGMFAFSAEELGLAKIAKGVYYVNVTVEDGAFVETVKFVLK